MPYEMFHRKHCSNPIQLKCTSLGLRLIPLSFRWSPTWLCEGNGSSVLIAFGLEPARVQRRTESSTLIWRPSEVMLTISICGEVWRNLPFTTSSELSSRAESSTSIQLLLPAHLLSRCPARRLQLKHYIWSTSRTKFATKTDLLAAKSYSRRPCPN